ncbi:MAG: tetratricopeptide repeat protein, partial [Desertifilum sp. SIO1I2]|nr:tetratricopeptide repeat protein [Desertifilum sp. SIO1I2]
ILAYQQALAIDPQFVVAYYNLGMVCKQLGKIPEAIAAYQSAIPLIYCKKTCISNSNPSRL